MEQNEMMAVNGGGKGHDAANTIASAGVFCASSAVEATAATAAISTGVMFASGALLLASVISYNYNYTSRKPPKNSHHR